jgi:C-terminal processing protease CtpA/Prc
MTADQEPVRLADIIITWNVFQHFYPYFAEIDTDWDAELTYSLKRAMQDDDADDFFLTLNYLVAQLHDGHGNVYDQKYMNRFGFPIRLEWIEDQVVVTASEDPEHFQRGDIIMNIDGKSARQMVFDAEDYISGSPQWKRAKVFWRFAYGEKGTPAKFRIKRGKDTLEFSVERTSQKLIPETNRPNVEELEDNVFYVNLDLATWKEISDRLEDIAKARGIIFDMRGYPNSNHAIISHLLKENDTSDAWMQIPQIIYPDRKNTITYEKIGWKMPAREPHITGKVVFITDGRAISYAESFMSFIEHYQLGEIVGGPTAGANGNINPFILPGNLRVIYTGMKVVKHDGSQHHTIGIQPTVPMTRTIQGVMDGRDELFEKALEIIKNK